MPDVIIGRIFSGSVKERENEFAQQGKAINANLRLFRSVAAVLLERKKPSNACWRRCSTS
jgi:hypothetical protein